MAGFSRYWPLWRTSTTGLLAPSSFESIQLRSGRMQGPESPFFRKKGGGGSYLEDDHPSQWGSRGSRPKMEGFPQAAGLGDLLTMVTNHLLTGIILQGIYTILPETSYKLTPPCCTPAGFFFGIDLTFSGEFPRTLPNLKQKKLHEYTKNSLSGIPSRELYNISNLWGKWQSSSKGTLQRRYTWSPPGTQVAATCCRGKMWCNVKNRNYKNYPLFFIATSQFLGLLSVSNWIISFHKFSLHLFFIINS